MSGMLCTLDSRLPCGSGFSSFLEDGIFLEDDDAGNKAIVLPASAATKETGESPLAAIIADATSTKEKFIQPLPKSGRSSLRTRRMRKGPLLASPLTL